MNRLVLITLVITNLCFSFTLELDFESSANSFNFGTLVDSVSAKGSQSCKIGVEAGKSFFGGTKNIPQAASHNDEVWIRLFYYFEKGFSWGNSGGSDAWGYTKWLRLETNLLSGEQWVGRRTTLQLGNQKSGAPILVTQEWNTAKTDIKFGGSEDYLTTGKWIEIQWYIKFHSNPDSGKMRMWKGDKLLGEFVGQTMDNKNRTIDELVVGDHWNGGVPQNQDFFMDDFIFTTETPNGRDSNGNLKIKSAPSVGLVGRPMNREGNVPVHRKRRSVDVTGRTIIHNSSKRFSIGMYY